ncbi:MAG: hypothetical protein SGI77_07460 [Pirellulaceae bacterium]|nr:hypothetical protein [Pirellulaceae bacterium]
MNSPLDAHRPFAMPSDFYRLGLKRGECNSVAIRGATQSAVHRLAESSTRQTLEQIDRQLGQLATSAYRLLDPRYRLQFYERIQLSYAVERDDMATSNLHPEALLSVPRESIALDRFSEDIPLVEDRLGSTLTLDGAREVLHWIRHGEEELSRFRPTWTKRFFLSLKAWLANRSY